MTFRFQTCTVRMYEDRTVTRFDSGREVVAAPDGTPDQPEYLWREHDLWHSALAAFLGMEVSPTLDGLAHPERALPVRVQHLEEAAVLAVEAWARAMGVDVREVAARVGKRVR